MSAPRATLSVRRRAEFVWPDHEPTTYAAELLSARLAGRHGDSRKLVLYGLPRALFTEEERQAIFAAFDAGVADRKKGMRCLCNRCILPRRVSENDSKRWRYADRRRSELHAQGFEPAEIEKRVLEEIDRGMAL